MPQGGLILLILISTMATFGLIRNFYTTENKMRESSIIRVAPIFVNESDETFQKSSRCGFVTRFSSPGVYV